MIYTKETNVRKHVRFVTRNGGRIQLFSLDIQIIESEAQNQVAKTAYDLNDLRRSTLALRETVRKASTGEVDRCAIHLDLMQDLAEG
jgi:hypothetical protein